MNAKKKPLETRAYALSDPAGTNLGYSNDSTSGLQAGQKARLQFEITEAGVSGVKITEMSCY